jgi:hypothetical protein
MRAEARGNSKWRCKRLPKEHTEEVVSWSMRGYNRYMVSQVSRGGRAVQSQRVGKHGDLQNFVDHEFDSGRVPVFIFLQETWLRRGQSPFSLNGYEWFGTTRSVADIGGNYRGGGRGVGS